MSKSDFDVVAWCCENGFTLTSVGEQTIHDLEQRIRREALEKYSLQVERDLQHTVNWRNFPAGTFSDILKVVRSALTEQNQAGARDVSRNDEKSGAPASSSTPAEQEIPAQALRTLTVQGASSKMPASAGSTTSNEIDLDRESWQAIKTAAAADDSTKPAPQSETPETDELLLQLNGDPPYKSLTESDGEDVVRLARSLERRLRVAEWELNERRGLDKAREEERLRERQRAEDAEQRAERLAKDVLDRIENAEKRLLEFPFKDWDAMKVKALLLGFRDALAAYNEWKEKREPRS